MEKWVLQFLTPVEKGEKGNAVKERMVFSTMILEPLGYPYVKKKKKGKYPYKSYLKLDHSFLLFVFIIF